MSQRPVVAAAKPPEGITGLDSSWSRLVEAADAEGIVRTWHLLDSWATRLDASASPTVPSPTVPSPTVTSPTVTILCVHGNPSWSFLWRHVVAQAAEDVRVIAVDQLDMGFSERTGAKRTLSMRVEDLCSLTDTLKVEGPVVTLAHDWGGPVSLGWALRHLPTVEPLVSAGEKRQTKVHLAGVVLTNTAVHQPESASAPSVIRLIRSKILLRSLTVRSMAFINGAMRMSRPELNDEVQAGFIAPYREASRRTAIADFVADIPLAPTHESAKVLDEITTGLVDLANTPALLLWGPRDKVFSDLYLHDMEKRLPHAHVHRFPNAAHFVTEDANVAEVVHTWIEGFVSAKTPVNEEIRETQSSKNRSRALADFTAADPDVEAIVETSPVERSINFHALGEKTQLLAAGMAAFGIESGDRVAVMITPGINLSTVVYACWRLGATLVLVDSGLGRKGMQGALKSANPAYLIGIDKALVAARLLGWPGRRIAISSGASGMRSTLGIVSDLDALCSLGEGKALPPWPTPETVAAIAFTSGSTGPSKGVIYLHRQIQAQRDALMNLYGIKSDDRLVAAFAPFALYGPTMGITSIVPVMDVTKPSTLIAQSLAEAVKRIEATLVFASPAALVNVVATENLLTDELRTACAAVRLTLSAGAPVRASLLTSVRTLFPNASLHTPYGMTEVLPVADISLDELTALEEQQHAAHSSLPTNSTAGVCVGHPVQDVFISIDPLDRHGQPNGELTTNPDILGEIIVRAPHARHGYDRLWFTDIQASNPRGTHRTGDIGQLDKEGRLWVGGRLGHVIVTDSGPIAPVAGEQILEGIEGVAMAALVGVGPQGTQVVVAVLQMMHDEYPVGGAPLVLIDRVRACMSQQVDIASVLLARQLPVDRRHNSKVDRTAIASWAAKVLAGDKVGVL